MATDIGAVILVVRGVHRLLLGFLTQNEKEVPSYEQKSPAATRQLMFGLGGLIIGGLQGIEWSPVAYGSAPMAFRQP